MSPTVLCADPDRQLCQILARALGADGHRVVVAHDAEQVLRAVRSAAPDVLLLEMALPPADGLTVLGQVRALGERAAAIPTLLLSQASCTPAEIERARGLKASALLRKPVALDDLAARVAKLAARRRAARPSAAAARPAPLVGSLADLPFPALLHQVHGLRASGVLQLRAGRKEKQIALVDGRPAAVRSNLDDERLGEWLVRTGRIPHSALAESVQRMQRGEGHQGEILVAMQVLSEKELVGALQRQADDKLFEVFEWREGGFELALGARIERATALALSRSPADVICLGVRSRHALDRIDAVLGRHAEHVAVASANPFYAFQEIGLGDEERRLLAAGQRGLELRRLLERPPPERRALYALLETELLELREGAAWRSGTPAARVRLHPAARPQRRDAAAAPPRGGPTPRAAAAPPTRVEPPAPARPTSEHAHFAADTAEREALAALVDQVRVASPFAKLGLAPDASTLEIRAAYMRLAKQTHPDRWGAASHAVRSLAEEAFREITRAYDLLSDPERLAAYRADPNLDARNARAAAEAQRALSAEQEFQKGEARLRAHDWSGALAHFERAVELYPDEGEYLAYCGWAYYLTHGHEAAVVKRAFDLVKRGAKLAPDREKPFLFLGRLCEATGRLELAEKMFSRAIERRPDSIEAMRALRLLEMRRPRKSLIKRLLRRPA